MEMESRRKPFTKINKFMDSEKTQDHNIEKKCWKCGASLATDAKFCPACLADVSVSGVSNDPIVPITFKDLINILKTKLQNNSKHSDFVQRDRLESSDANWAKYLDLNQKTFKLGGKIERLAAFIIDELIAIICLLPLGTTFFSALGTNDQEMMMNAISGKLEMVLFLTFVPIIIQAYLVTTRGQSIGKIVMSLRIVNAKDGTNPGFLKAFFVRRILPAPLFFLPPILLLYSVVNVLFIFRSDRRCIHDWIGRTIVVESKIDKLEKKDK